MTDTVQDTEPRPTPRFLAQPPPMPKVPGKLGIAFIGALVALAAINGGWSLLRAIGALTLIVSLHELGHFLTAKWAHMKVTEFFLGIGPKLWSTTRGETEYGVKLIPAVAYVRIIGMHNLEDVPEADEPRSYRQQVFHKRLIVVCAGSAMHFLMAFIALWGLLVFNGAPHGHLRTNVPPTGFKIEATEPGSAADRAGVQPNDRITVFDGQAVSTADDLSKVIQADAGKAVDFTVDRGGETAVLHATVGEQNGKGHLGIQMVATYPPDQKVGALAAVPRAVDDFGHIGVEVVKGIGSVFSPSGISHLFTLVANGKSTDQGPVVASPGPSSSPSATPAPSSSSDNNPEDRPISIIGITQLASELNGPEFIFVMFVLVNIFFGIFNLLPLLPFDGGHAAIAVYEKIQSMRLHRPYRADILKLLPLTYGVVAVLLLVGLSAMYLDIVLGTHV